MYRIKQLLICFWLHHKYKCFPQVPKNWPLKHWHCTKCHPCGEIFDV